MSNYKRKRKRRTYADNVLYRMHMVRSWRNYDFYLSSSHKYYDSFRCAYHNDYISLLYGGGSLHSFLVSHEKAEKLVREVFNEKRDYSFRRDCLERIERLKKRGKAKLLIGHLYDDVKEDVSQKTPVYFSDGTVMYKEDLIDFDPPIRHNRFICHSTETNDSKENLGEKHNLGAKSLEEIIKKLVEIDSNLRREDSE